MALTSTCFVYKNVYLSIYTVHTVHSSDKVLFLVHWCGAVDNTRCNVSSHHVCCGWIVMFVRWWWLVKG